MRAARRTPDGRPRSGRRRSFRTHSVPTGRPAAAPHRTGTPRTKPQEPRGPGPRRRARVLERAASIRIRQERPWHALVRRCADGSALAPGTGNHTASRGRPAGDSPGDPAPPKSRRAWSLTKSVADRRTARPPPPGTAARLPPAATPREREGTGGWGERYGRRRADSCGASGRSGRTHRLEARHPAIATSALRSGYIHVGCTRRFVTLASRSPDDRPGALLLEPPLFECLNNTNAT